MLLKIIPLIAISFILSGCRKTGSNEPLLIEITTNKLHEFTVPNMNGTHAVGIICEPSVWKEIVENSNYHSAKMTVKGENTSQLLSFGRVGHSGTFCDQVPNCSYLFTISSNTPVIITIKLKASQVRKLTLVVTKSPQQTLY
jgi:hypothetical protein